MPPDTHDVPLQKVLLKARITFNHGASSLDCLVREFSATGARLALSETAPLPDTFDLHIPQKGKTYRAALLWRREDGIGVTFPGEISPAASALTASDHASADASRAMLLRRMTELEAENLALRQALAGLIHPDARSSAVG